MRTSNSDGFGAFCGKSRFFSRGLLLTAAVTAGLGGSKVNAGVLVISGGYHAQVTNHWCGSASLEMMLDVPTVRNNNAAVNSLLSATDGPTVAFGDPAPVINNVTHQVTFGAQSFLYGLNHGTNYAFSGANSQSYFNPSWPVGAGTDTPGVVADANILDSTTSPQGLGFGNDNYQGYSEAPNLTGQALASRTVANALNDFRFIRSKRS